MEKRRLAGIGFIAGRWPLHPSKPTLIFIHGAGFTHVAWRKQVAALSEAANCIALDLPGHGASDGPSCATIAEYADRVYAFVHGLDVAAPYVCGHSMGGAIVMRLIMDHGPRFAGAVLANTGARLKVAPEILQAIETDYEAYLQGLADFATSPSSDRAALAPLLHEACAHEQPVVVAGDFRACDGFDVMSELWRISLPTLVITADDDRVTPPKYGQYLAEQIDGAVLEAVARAGHLAPMEQPEAVSGAIERFLRAQR